MEQGQLKNIVQDILEMDKKDEWEVRVANILSLKILHSEFDKKYSIIVVAV